MLAGDSEGVAGDLHDIGKNLVAMLLESAGFEVIDLGVNVSVEQFIKAVEEHEPQIVGFSALLTTTMAAMRETNQAIVEKFTGVKTIVGGLRSVSNLPVKSAPTGMRPIVPPQSIWQGRSSRNCRWIDK